MDNLKSVDALKQNLAALSERDKSFAESLLSQLERKGSLSDKQWYWIGKLADTAEKAKEGIPDFTQEVEVGDFGGVIQLFKNAAASGLKNPKIRLGIPMGTHNQPLALSVAGHKSKHPGCVNVTNGEPYHHNTWFGRITPHGVWQPSQHVEPDLMARLMTLLSALAQDPAGTASKYGRLVGYCCFCHSELSDERSKAVGYGPVCAKNWGLPWGDLPELKEVA